ncbi:hypothetical protein OAL13_00200 [bacterium]|nr:hypothetical protein [bacterium]
MKKAKSYCIDEDFKARHNAAYHEALDGFGKMVIDSGLINEGGPNDVVQVGWTTRKTEEDVPNLCAFVCKPGQHGFHSVGAHFCMSMTDSDGKAPQLQFWGVEDQDLVAVGAQIAELNQPRPSKGFGR